MITLFLVQAKHVSFLIQQNSFKKKIIYGKIYNFSFPLDKTFNIVKLKHILKHYYYFS